MLCSAVLLNGGDLDLDQYCRVNQASRDHGSGRPSGAEGLFESGPALAELRCVREDVRNSHDVADRCTGLCDSGLDIGEALFSLVLNVVCNGHCGVVVAGGTGDEDPIAVNDGAAEADFGFEGGAGGDELSGHGGSGFVVW